MPSKIFTGVTPAKMDAIRTELLIHGVIVPAGNYGQVMGHTFFGSACANFVYDPAGQTLTISGVTTTGLISADDVFDQIGAALNG
jgi:hypothetical protein